MSHIAIRVENLSKKYVISHQPERGHHNYTALRDVITDEAYSALALFGFTPQKCLHNEER